VGSSNKYNALAQEKTGDFWVNGFLFGQARRNFADSGIPIYSFKAAVASLSKRGGEAIGMILIVVQPLRLLTRVASGGRMRAVASNLHDLPPLGHRLDAAVDVGEAAHRRLPLVFVGYCSH